MATFTAEGLLKALESTFDKSSREDLSDYLSGRGPAQKWLIASDYCLHDDGKFNDVIAFTAFPGEAAFPTLDDDIQKQLPRDWKQIKTIDDDMAHFLRDGDHFHICFLVDRKRQLFSCDGVEAERETVRDAVSELLHVAESWPDAAKHLDSIKAIRYLNQQVLKKSFNVELFKDLYLTSLFAAFVSYIFARDASADIVSWFSDRDSILTWAPGAAHAYYSTAVASLCRQNGIREPKVLIGVPTNSASGQGMFYDPFVRVPDFYAGGLASWNFEENRVAAAPSKYRELVEKVICNNRRLSALVLRISADAAMFTRLVVDKNAKLSPMPH
jgi:hypothetical protein